MCNFVRILKVLRVHFVCFIVRLGYFSKQVVDMGGIRLRIGRLRLLG